VSVPEVAILAFAASVGVAAPLSPCGLAVLPAFISLQLTAERGPATRSVRVPRWALTAATSSLGMVTVLWAAAATVAVGGRLLLSVSPFLGIGIGILLILAGLSSLLGHPPALPPVGTKLITGTAPWVRSFAFGCAYAATSLSCSLPLFLGLLGAALSTGNYPATFLTVAFYSLGAGLTLLTITIFTTVFKHTLVLRMRAGTTWLQHASAALLVLSGFYLIYYWTNSLG
jgi:cytochrome c-type biogenesis protein